MLKFKRKKKWNRICHEPIWQPAELIIDAEGNTKPGFICVHELENGNGQCGGNTFSIDQAIGNHACIVQNDSLQGKQNKN